MKEIEDKIKKKLAEQKELAVKAAAEGKKTETTSDTADALEQAAEAAAAAQMQNVDTLDTDADLDIAAESDFAEFEPTE